MMLKRFDLNIAGEIEYVILFSNSTYGFNCLLLVELNTVIRRAR